MDEAIPPPKKNNKKEKEDSPGRPLASQLQLQGPPLPHSCSPAAHRLVRSPTLVFFFESFKGVGFPSAPTGDFMSFLQLDMSSDWKDPFICMRTYAPHPSLRDVATIEGHSHMTRPSGPREIDWRALRSAGCIPLALPRFGSIASVKMQACSGLPSHALVQSILHMQHIICKQAWWSVSTQVHKKAKYKQFAIQFDTCPSSGALLREVSGCLAEWLVGSPVSSLAGWRLKPP